MGPAGLRRIGLLAIAAVVAGCAFDGANNPAGGGDTRADQNPVVLTIATGEGAPVEAQGFADEVRRISNGAIDVVVDNTAVAGEGLGDYETKVIRYVAEGKAELGFVAARAFDTVGIDSFAPLHAPFLIDSVSLEAQVLASGVARGLLEGTRPAGVVGIGYVQGPLRRPLGYTRALLDVQDYAGARIGIRGSDLIDMTMRALGATPDVFPPGDTTGLDGMEVHVAQIGLGQYDVGADSLTGNVVFWPRPGVIFANATVFDALTMDQQATLREAGATNLDSSVASMAEWERANFEGPCWRGLQVKMAPDSAVAGLREAVQPVYDEIERGDGARAEIEAIEAMKASLKAPVDTAECEVAAATPLPSETVADSPLVGTWTTSFTREELAESPHLYDVGEINDGNWGDLTLTFQVDGHVSAEQHNLIVSSSTSGRYFVDGDRLVMIFDEGDNQGEIFGARWSVFRDTLTFERVERQVLPTPYVVRAWTRGS